MTNDFTNKYLCRFKISEREWKLRDMAKRYHDECEAYNRTVCTGWRNGATMPIDPFELRRVMSNAHSVRKRINAEAENCGLTLADLSLAIRRHK